MADGIGANEMPNRSSQGESYDSYFKRAVDACEAGDLVLGMHLYLAAYERAVIDPAIPDGMALAGLREAWNLACDLKERSLAEYVFEKLEPYLTGEEIAACAQQLQDMALDRLAQYGFSREELEGMAEMIAQDYVGEGSVVKVESISIPSVPAFGSEAIEVTGTVVAVSPGSEERDSREFDEEEPGGAGAVGAAGGAGDSLPGALAAQDAAEDAAAPEPEKKGKPNHVAMSRAAVDDFNPYDYYSDNSIGKSYHAATNEGTGSYVFTRDVERAEAGLKAAQAAEAARADAAEAAEAAHGDSASDVSAGGEGQAKAAAEPALAGASDAGASAKPNAKEGESRPRGLTAASAGAKLAAREAALAAKGAPAAPTSPTSPDQASSASAVLSYRNLAGYDGAVEAMRELGIGLQNERAFIDFLEMLNEQHGLDRPPALDSLIVRAPVLEDATRFVDATIGEIGLPILRMSMEESVQGIPMLCVTTQGNSRPRMNQAHNRFEAPAILVLDDLDTWVMPSMPDTMEGMGGFVMANISRAARETVNMIRASVEDPDVFVLATATTEGEPDPFFYDMLEPLTVIDVANPTDKERADIWTEIARNHPSMRSISRSDLTRFSEGLSRFDIYMAAREALEEAYKSGLVSRRYVPVTPYNIFEKIAACQPLESDVYRALEDAVVSSFQDELDDLEGFVGGMRE